VFIGDVKRMALENPFMKVAGGHEYDFDT